MTHRQKIFGLFICSFLCWPTLAFAAGVQVLFSLDDPAGGPFPSNLFTVADLSHNTGLRVNLPFPDCAVRPSDCLGLAVINTLDGFNVQPRLSIPFSGPIDANTITSKTVFLVRLGSLIGVKVIGINQVVWDPATNTLHVESDELLEQHTRYALIVTRKIRDTAGKPVEASGAFARFFAGLPFGQTQAPALKAYHKTLVEAVVAAAVAKVNPLDIVAVSVFTTQSTTAVLEKIRNQIKAATPERADFLLGPGGTRTVFPLNTATGVTFNEQVGTAPLFNPSPVPTEALGMVPGAVGQLAFGKYLSPDYETAEKFIPPVGTRSGTPAIQGVNEIYFNLLLPAGPKPAGGWPVAIYGHGAGTNKNYNAFIVAATLANQGIATIAINGVGNGGGSLSTLTVNQTGGGAVTFSAGGRGIDQDGDGFIFAGEGRAAAFPRSIIGDRDGKQQTVADLMQLVRELEIGMDVDGDSVPDLDPTRVYYTGNSLGGIYGTIFLAVEPSVRAGVLNTPGGPFIETFRLSPYSRPFLGFLLSFNVPSLINVGGPSGFEFDENLPFRNQPPVINNVPGALALQQAFDSIEWVQQAGEPVAYAPHLRKRPLKGIPAKSVIIQFAKGDGFVPNPTSTALLRAGGLASRATFYRHDLAFADPVRNPTGAEVPTEPHGFILDFLPAFFPNLGDVGLGAQQQIAAFFASDGATVIDPDGVGPLFEVPIIGPLPEELNFIP